MIEPRADRPRAEITLRCRQGFPDAEDFVNDLRSMTVTPHVAQNTSGRSSAIDARTTRHGGYAVSQRVRKHIEEAFGWIKTVARREDESSAVWSRRVGLHLLLPPPTIWFDCRSSSRKRVDGKASRTTGRLVGHFHIHNAR